MFTNMLTPHHGMHRPGSPLCPVSMTGLSGSGQNSLSPPEQKYAPLHNAADAMRRHCMPSPVAYSGNLFAGFDESFLARAEALAAVDYTNKGQFKPEASVSTYYPMSAPSHHHMSNQSPNSSSSSMGSSPMVHAQMYSTMPPPGIHHPSALHPMTQSLGQSSLSLSENNDIMDHLGNTSHCSSFSTYQPPTLNSSSGMSGDISSFSVSQPHYMPTLPAPHGGIVPGFNHSTTGSMPFPTSTSLQTQTSNSEASQAPGECSPTIIQHTLPTSEYDTDPRELEAFAERFKQRRIKLGVTQCDVGQALANLKLPGVGSLSQSTICRFESLTLSHNNMVALKPILMTWLEKAEEEYRRKMEEQGINEKKRKRTSIAAPEKRSLEAYFTVQPRPSSEKIAAIAEKLDLKKNVVRVWFCNQRQKQKRMKFSAFNGENVI